MGVKNGNKYSEAEIDTALALAAGKDLGPKRYYLTILSKDQGSGEIFYSSINDGHKEGVKYRHEPLYLTGLLLRSCYKFTFSVASNNKANPPKDVFPHPSKINPVIAGFYKKVAREEITPEMIPDEPVPWGVETDEPAPSFLKEGSEFAKSVSFVREVKNLCKVVMSWLSPEALKNQRGDMAKLLNPDEAFIHKDLNSFFYYRCRQLIAIPEFYDGEIITRYESSGILPLCWAEIWHALENKIRAGVCPFCGSAYINSPHKSKAHCGRSECKTAYLKEKNGPRWESERKTRKDPERKGILGRPPSKKTLEDRKKAIEMDQGGCAIGYIAKTLKVSESKVGQWLCGR